MCILLHIASTVRITQSNFTHSQYTHTQCAGAELKTSQPVTEFLDFDSIFALEISIRFRWIRNNVDNLCALLTQLDSRIVGYGVF